MSKIIDLYDFLSNKKIVHCETATNYHDAIRFLVENKDNADAITYDSVRHFSINNLSMLELDREGNYFYEFYADRLSDIMDNISFEKSQNLSAQFTYYINGRRYLPHQVKKFVACAAMYSEFKIRITFLKKPDANDEFKMTMRNYLLNIEDRKLLSNSYIIKCDDIKYCDGVCDYIFD